jgi:hypothetical protein
LIEIGGITMDVREKLVVLILNADVDEKLGSYDFYELTHERTGCAEYFADYLIAHGVTVQDRTEMEMEQCCISLNAYGGDCDEGCPLCGTDCCGFELLTHALDLINRQQAEIEKLHKEVEYWEVETKEARAEIDQAVKEAIKEFAERLKEYTYDGGPHPTVWDKFAYAVDNLVEEMVGDVE